MSLLLEALKKAEKAKEEAQRRAQGERAEAPAPQTSAPPEPEPVRTRNELPDIRQPLEILSEEPSKPEPSLAEEKPARAEPPPSRPAPKPEAAQASERAAARKVFEAKFREPNPRLPFLITLGALGVFAVGTVVYFWLQLRPPAPLVNLNPKPPAGEVQVAAAAPAKPAVTPAPTPTAPTAPAPQTVIPGLPAAPTMTVPPRPSAPVVETPLIKPQPKPALRAPAPAESEISTTRQTPQVHPRVGTAYAAYLAGDMATARSDYQQALREEPANRDALLGMAALDVRAGRLESAEAAYLRLLQADPRDAHAHAAMLALRSGRVDPVAAESRVKSMLADNPGAHVLNFTLGNQFAQQGRWAEAQQEYFKAFASEPENADFAYNLAVSLDHLRQPRLALEYYQRALALARGRGAGFDLAAAESRVAQLSR
jgi:tetratricopeptide (TPR) repeat protein